jgi:hypothetical protein
MTLGNDTPLSPKVRKDEPVIGCKEAGLPVPHRPVKGMAVDEYEGAAIGKIVVSQMYSSYFFCGHGLWHLGRKVRAR